MRHVLCIPKDVSICKKLIESRYISRYKDLWTEKNQSTSADSKHKCKQEQILQDNNKADGACLQKCTRKDQSMTSFLTKVSSKQSSQTSTPHSDTSSIPTLHSNASIYSGNESRLTMAIADFIYSEGLPFSICECPRFKQIIQLSKGVRASYEPPKREAVRTSLLQLSWENNKKRTREKLLREAEVFGISFLGDGATLKKMPLVNFLASGVHQPASVLEIADASGLLQTGGKKDAPTLANLFLPHLLSIDPQKTITDCIFFDGAGNVQKAGSLLQVRFPHTYTFHGAEHVVSLFFKDIASLEPVFKLILEEKKLYSVFVSGSNHSAFAPFSKQAQDLNNGWKIGLIKAADTRMAGYFMALHRSLRLKTALEATICSLPFRDLNLDHDHMTEIVMNEKRWERIYLILKSTFSALRVLRLADSNSAGMDKLFYLTRQTEKNLERLRHRLNSTKLFGPGPVQVIKLSIRDYLAEDKSESEYDESEDDSGTDGSESESDNDSNNSSIHGEVLKCDLGDLIIAAWKKRAKHLKHDYSVTGWLLSVCPEKMADVASNESGEHYLCADCLIERLFHGCTEDELGDKKDKFWTEYQDFKNKSGNFEHAYIWNSKDIQDGNSHLWHQKYSLKFTEVLGYVACWVTSKILGIGAAERAWKHVKILKSGQRGRLEIDSLEKQAIIYSQASMDNACLNMSGDTLNHWWNKDNEDYDLGLDKWDVEITNRNRTEAP